MIGICYRYTANRQLAEDLAHDAFLKAIDKAESFKGDGVFEGWLRRVVVNHVLTYIRDQKRHQRIDEWLHYEGTVVHSDDDNVVTDSSDEADFSVQELLEVINYLPEHHRLVFNLYVIDDFKHAQIAEALGISEGTSKSHLARARKKIRQLLAEKKRGRRAIFLLLFPGVGRLYNKQFNNFELAHHKALRDFNNIRSISIAPPYSSAPWIKIAAASFVGSVIVVSAIFYLTAPKNETSLSNIELTQSVSEDSANTRTSRDDKDRMIVTDEKNNSDKTGTATATLPGNRVIQGKIIKPDTMKTLDSVAIALLMSSVPVIDSLAQSKVKVDTTTPIKTHKVAMGNDPVETTSIVQFSAPARAQKNETQQGTFYATSLYWSAENHELYFKGKVKVDVGENNFVSTGSVTFLDKVYLLIIDDNPVKLDSTIKLSQQQYRLKQLNRRDATSKYGDNGVNGAVEINVIE